MLKITTIQLIILLVSNFDCTFIVVSCGPFVSPISCQVTFADSCWNYVEMDFYKTHHSNFMSMTE